MVHIFIYGGKAAKDDEEDEGFKSKQANGNMFLENRLCSRNVIHVVRCASFFLTFSVLL